MSDWVFESADFRKADTYVHVDLIDFKLALFELDKSPKAINKQYPIPEYQAWSDAIDGHFLISCGT